MSNDHGEDREGLPPGDHECENCGGTGRVSDPMLPTTGRYRYHLTRGWRKEWLIRQLAAGDLSKAELARLLQCSRQAMREFEQRFDAEIASKRAHLEAEFHGLWIAQKVARLAEYQQDAEDAQALIAAAMEGTVPRPVDPLEPDSPDDDSGDTGSNLVPLIKVKQAALKSAAEELGQLPNRVRMDIGGKIATYRIEGADLDRI